MICIQTNLISIRVYWIYFFFVILEAGMNRTICFMLYLKIISSKRVCNRIEKAMYSMFNATKISTIWMGKDHRNRWIIESWFIYFASLELSKEQNFMLILLHCRESRLLILIEWLMSRIFLVLKKHSHY